MPELVDVVAIARAGGVLRIAPTDASADVGVATRTIAVVAIAGAGEGAAAIDVGRDVGGNADARADADDSADVGIAKRTIAVAAIPGADGRKVAVAGELLRVAIPMPVPM